MIDLYLRAGNAGAMANAVPFLRVDTDGNGTLDWATSGEGFAALYIGKLVVEEAEFDEEGNMTKPPVFDEGFHINLRCTEEVAALVPESVRVNPSTPRFVWL